MTNPLATTPQMTAGVRRPRITPMKAAEIRRLRAEGLLLREIASLLGVSVNSAARYARTLGRSQRAIAPRVRSGGFIAPPSLARLMAGR